MPGTRPGMPNAAGVTRGPLRRNPHILEIAGLVVDADAGRRDPAGEFARLDDLAHQACDKIAIVFRRQPLALAAVPARLVEKLSVRRDFHILELADLAAEADMRQLQLERDAGLGDD